MNNNLTDSCPLCHTQATVLSDKGFFLCKECQSVFRDKKLFLNSLEEKSHYEKHNNDVNDKEYQKFVFPITEAV